MLLLFNNCNLLLMETVKSQVWKISHGLYRTPAQSSIQYLCSVKNTPSSGSCRCFSSTPSSRSESEAWLANWIHLVLYDARIFEIESFNERTRSFTEIGETQFHSCPARRTVHRKRKWYAKLPLIIWVQLFSNFSNNGRERLLVKISAPYLQCSHNEIWLSLWNFLLNREMSNINELCSCNGFGWTAMGAFLQFKILFPTSWQSWWQLARIQLLWFPEEGFKLSFCGNSCGVILFSQRVTKDNQDSVFTFLFNLYRKQNRCQ
jgi:hypothetical protein